MREMRGKVGKKTPKKEMDNPSFLLRQMDHFGHIFNTIWDLSILKINYVYIKHSVCMYFAIMNVVILVLNLKVG